MAVQKSKEYQKKPEYGLAVSEGQKQWRDKLYGIEKEHTKICQTCKKEFKWFGREFTNGFKGARFCSISCSKSRSEYWDKNATRYGTIAFKAHEKKCIICGFDKIVAVHHYDHNKENNDPSNLIPLCPNHHHMIHHKKYEKEIKELVDIWRSKLPIQTNPTIQTKLVVDSKCD